MKNQYSDSMEEITGITDEDAHDIGIIPNMISRASKEGLTLLQVQLKVFLRYVEIRLNDK